jgi:exodeoxyribonuclease VII large subunit
MTENKSRKYDFLKEKLELLSPKNRIERSYDKVDVITKNLNDYYMRFLTKKSNDYVVSINKLELLNPLSIMKKGYTVTKKEGKILKSVTQVNQNDQIDILMNDGSLKATINEVRKGE